jgi:hypothetical protein
VQLRRLLLPFSPNNLFASLAGIYFSQMDKGGVAKPAPIAFAELGPFNDASGENFADLLSRSVKGEKWCRWVAGNAAPPR